MTEHTFLRRHAWTIVGVLAAALVALVVLVGVLVVRPDVRPAVGDPIRMPGVLDLSGLDARERLERAGLGEVYWFDLDGGLTNATDLSITIDQHPSAGELVEGGSPVFIVGLHAD